MRPYLYALIPITLVIVIYVINADRAARAASERPLSSLREIPSKLVSCSACSASISRDAKTCPHCGDPR